MDQCTRRIVGFGVHRGAVDGVGLCRMFNRATRCHTPPTYLSSDHDPMYRFHQWPANLWILDVKEIKTVPYVPLSHPFVERLIGTVRRECLDRTLFWTAADLEGKLLEFQRFYNGHKGACGTRRAHAGTAHGHGLRTREYSFVPMGTALSWAVSDANGGMTCVRWNALEETSCTQAASTDQRHRVLSAYLKLAGYEFVQKPQQRAERLPSTIENSPRTGALSETMNSTAPQSCCTYQKDNRRQWTFGPECERRSRCQIVVSLDTLTSSRTSSPTCPTTYERPFGRCPKAEAGEAEVAIMKSDTTLKRGILWALSVMCVVRDRAGLVEHLRRSDHQDSKELKLIDHRVVPTTVGGNQLEL